MMPTTFSMPPRRTPALLLALCVLAAVILMTSPHARTHHDNLRHLLADDRPKGRHRNRDRNNDNRKRNRDLDSRHHNRTRFSFTGGDDDDDDADTVGVEVELTSKNSRYRSPRPREGISVPSLLSMQTLGLAQRNKNRRRHEKNERQQDDGTRSGEAELTEKPSRKQRRPIKGSQKAVVVTQMTYLKKDWCKTQPLKQIVRMKGCLRTKILNNFCYGQCNSFYIPKKARKDKDTEAFLSCGFCRPRRIRWILVTLRCPGPNGMRYKRKRVQYIKKCRCMAQDVSVPPVS